MNMRELLADYGCLRYFKGKNSVEKLEWYENMLVQMGMKHGIVYDLEDDVESYSGENPIDMINYLEHKLDEHLSEEIFSREKEE